MKNKQILFTEPNVAELVETQVPGSLEDNQVLVETEYTIISPGTERANLIGEYNINGEKEKCNTDFPRALGYAGVGRVLKIGEEVNSIKKEQRVIVYFGKHMKYNLVNENNLIPITDDNLDTIDCVFAVIAGFSFEGVRKTRLEIGESSIVSGLGILGLLALQICRVSGSVPVIGVDPNLERRKLALELGADLVLDPNSTDFKKIVKDKTAGKGVEVVIEASGVNRALNQVLDVTGQFGRVSLLGCTRKPEIFDFYHKVHYPGISIIGANNFARPMHESRPGNWTAYDDTVAFLKLVASKRLKIKPMISQIYSPKEAPEVYKRLVNDKNFPIGVIFDWKEVK